ncbi:hypothetical protein BLA29_010297, partial [Euroglyphus maynei]
NSNLVLQADTRLIERRPRDEATGEVVSLVGKLNTIKMGDRYQRTKPQVDGKQTKKSHHHHHSDGNMMKMKKSLLSEDITESMGILYHPKTPETRETYELILAFISEMLGDQPRDVLCGAADEILQVMKADKTKEKEKKKECEALLGSLMTEKFSILSGLCRKITDFSFEDDQNNHANGDGNLDDTYGVNVQFEESDEEEFEGMTNEIRDDEDDEEEGEEAAIDTAIKAASNTAAAAASAS